MKDLTLPTPALPPLPELPTKQVTFLAFGEEKFTVTADGYTANQMQDYARAALSHHEDGGNAVAEIIECPKMGGQTVAEIDGRWKFLSVGTRLYTRAALGGEKGEAADMREAFWAWVDEQGCDTDGAWSAWQAAWDLRAAPVEARMLTEVEADHITDMHNTGRAQGDSECAEAIQRKFCEVNGIRLAGGNKGYV